jgi:hypothetical protein
MKNPSITHRTYSLIQMLLPHPLQQLFFELMFTITSMLPADHGLNVEVLGEIGIAVRYLQCLLFGKHSISLTWFCTQVYHLFPLLIPDMTNKSS